jgi:cytochrome P450
VVLKRDDGTGLNRNEMYNNASLFMVARTETTGMGGMTYYPLRNPDKMKKLTDDPCGAFATDADTNMEKVAKLKYDQACVEEVLYMYPPSLGGFP